jgi:hypothetical protein
MQILQQDEGYLFPSVVEMHRTFPGRAAAIPRMRHLLGNVLHRGRARFGQRRTESDHIKEAVVIIAFDQEDGLFRQKVLGVLRRGDVFGKGNAHLSRHVFQIIRTLFQLQ